MTTLREDIIRYSGETLEEGKFKNFLIASLVTAAAIAAAVKGVPAGKAAYEQYKYASAQPTSMKYMKADMNANRQFANWRGDVTIYTHYAVGQKQPILDIDIHMPRHIRASISGKSERTEIAKEIQDQILEQLDGYLDEIKKNSSKLEKYLSKDTYIGDVKPLKVQIDFKATDSEIEEIDNAKLSDKESAKAEFRWLSELVGLKISNEVARKLGVNREHIDIFINGQSAAFKR